ncbi:hypothetical protein BDV41DRAFT_552117 [Aspergillus transmontanensis]|uniref:Uncharacterized protein n=1 Tax=Aspergillus transmontanensis TaxID=1034304 RepID=A0A5N6VJA8_9EURO|nr:hypothetical protein BDV41DRAFT_552117 [Aspergillus transmontanensis]
MIYPRALKPTFMIQNLREARIQKCWWRPIASQGFTWRRADTCLHGVCRERDARTDNDQRSPPEGGDIKPRFSPGVLCYPRRIPFCTVGFTHSRKQEIRRIRRAVPAKPSVITTRIGSALGRSKAVLAGLAILNHSNRGETASGLHFLPKPKRPGVASASSQSLTPYRVNDFVSLVPPKCKHNSGEILHNGVEFLVE